jgi:hypothetical protein
MILSKTIDVLLSSQNIKHYESFGYVIPKHYDEQHYRWQVKRGTYINVEICHLPIKSHTSILCQCDFIGCSTTNIIPYKNLQRSFELNNGKYFCKFHSTQLSSFKEKISKSSQNKTMPSGKDHWCYNVNITDQERILGRNILGLMKWKKLVKQRDNYTCQKCGSIERLNVHHINNYKQFKEQRTDIDNGITLCHKCHKHFHKLFGKSNTTLNELNIFMSNI